MSEVRRDNKGRKLFNGESQRKDGKYEYKYHDAWGKRKTVYSWKLTPTDRVPAGKRDDISLREKIKQIQKDLNSNITPDGGNFTVLELVEKYISQKIGVRHNTRSNYKFVVNVIKKEAFGQKRIDKIKVSDAKEWLIKMQQIDGRGYSSIHTIRGVVRPALQRILTNRKNPKIEPLIDGYSGFLFLDKNGRPMVALHWEKYFQHIREKYNKIYKVQMPKVTPHVCRHTFCSNMAKSGMNPKTLQYIMGHSEIGATLNTYTHLGYEDAEEEMQKITEIASKKSTTHRKRCVS